MAALQNFRSALNGFNREDVVHYIEFINNQHNAQLNQLYTQMKTLQDQLDAMSAIPQVDPQTEEKLAQAEEKCAHLEAQLQEMQAQLTQAQAENESRKNREAELEAYRRAERAERVAQERVNQLYEQANGVIAQTTAKVDDSAVQISSLTVRIMEDLNALRSAVEANRDTLKNAAADLYTIRPVIEEA